MNFIYENKYNGPLDLVINELFNNNMIESNSPFPPYNIVKVDDNFKLEMPVHGRTKKDVELKYIDKTNTLEVSVDRLYEDDRDLIHSGLALRSYKQKFKLHKFLKVSGAQVENGLLIIDLNYQVPEEEKPVEIQVK